MIPVIIPSSGRANSVLTNISGAILYVHEKEADLYREHNQDTEVVTHGDVKNLAVKRQAIYEHWGDCFQVDDDISFVSRVYLPGNNREHHLSPSEIAELIQVTADNARSAGCYLFGFSNWPNAKHYIPHKPISLTGYINASAFGLLKSDKLYFTDRTTAAESHWINLLNSAMHRKSWSDTRFCFAQAPNSTFFRPGGQTEHRTMESEMKDTLFLMQMFGDAVKIKKSRGDAAAVHEYQRSIVNPL